MNHIYKHFTYTAIFHVCVHEVKPHIQWVQAAGYFDWNSCLHVLGYLFLCCLFCKKIIIWKSSCHYHFNNKWFFSVRILRFSNFLCRLASKNMPLLLLWPLSLLPLQCVPCWPRLSGPHRKVSVTSLHSIIFFTCLSL